MKFITIPAILLVFFCLNGQPLHSQTPFNGRITGSVTEKPSNLPLEYATVVLYTSPDTSLVTGTLVGPQGTFTLEVPKPGEFLIKIEFIGFKPQWKGPYAVNASQPKIDVGNFSLEIDETILDETVITKETGQMHIGLDKKVFNVSKDLSSIGGNASDVLQNIPSITIDIDGSVSLRGNPNVRILIDGKPSSLTGTGPAQVLEQIPASMIESVEIITNPSARYDAEGMTGIINIILKKQNKSGLNGMVGLTVGTRDNYTGSTTFNYGLAKFNFFGSYDARFTGMDGYNNSIRYTTLNDTTTHIDQFGEWERKGFSNMGRMGMDFRPDKFNSFTISGVINQGYGDMPSFTEYTNYDGNNIFQSRSFRSVERFAPERSGDLSFYYNRTFEKPDRKLTADFRYSAGSGYEPEVIRQTFYDQDSAPLYYIDQKSMNQEKDKNIIGQIDYVHPFSGKSKFEAGIKNTKRTTDVDYSIEEIDTVSGMWTTLGYLSNNYVFDENILAAYMTFGSSWKKFTAQVGLRGEITTIDAELKTTQQSFDRDYADLFPSVHIGYELSDINQFQIGYSRRVNRPRFHQLNPFQSYSDPLNIRIGNPALEPEFTDATDLDWIHYFKKGTMTIGIYYNMVHGMFQRLSTLQPDGVTTILTNVNLAEGKNYGTELTGSIEIFKWWRINGSLNYYRNIIRGKIQEISYDRETWSWSGRVNTNLNLPAGLDMQIMFNYRGRMEGVTGNVEPMYFVDLGFRKTVMKNKGTISLRVTDIFDTQKFEVLSFGPGFEINHLFKRESRNVVLGFNYKINNYKQRERQREDMEMEDVGF